MAKITTAGLALIAQLQAANDTLLIDKMIYANIDGLDPATEPPGTEVKPAVGDIVRESALASGGYVDPNTVVYSDVLDAIIGDFSFNWIGLFCTEHNTLIAVTYVPLQSKRKTAGFNIGNTLCKNFAINYTDIQDLTGIVIQAATWQQDFSGLYEPLGTVAAHIAAANPHSQYARIIEDFVSSKTASGYQKLPNGLIIQWGEVSATSGSWPIAFPTAVIFTIAQYYGGESDVNGRDYIFTTETTTGFTRATSSQCRYIAIGY